MKTKEYLWLSLLVLVTTGLGVLYAAHNTDPHHWGFITGGILDSMAGKRFFTEIYVQYGVGQSLLFGFLSGLFTVNYTSIGITTSLVYSLTLAVVYLGVKKVSNAALAVLVSALAALLHSYAIYPWPDYYAGFCLACACYLLIGKEESGGRMRGAFAGLLLFAAFLFRSTYMVSFLCAMAVYAAAALYSRPLRNRTLAAAVHVFLALSFAYLLFLVFRGDLFRWYDQAIGSAGSQYEVGSGSLLKLFKKVFLLYEDTLVNMIAAGMAYISLYAAYAAFFGKKETEKWPENIAPGTLFFFAFLGLSGFLQAAFVYEVFRIQNACSALYLVLAAWLAKELPNFNFRLLPGKLKLATAFFFLALFARFPYASVLYEVYDHPLGTYSAVDIPYYKWHRFRPEEKAYYEGLVKHICGGGKILNLTKDSSVPYLCGGGRNALTFPVYGESMGLKTDPVRVEEVRRAEFRPGEIVVSDWEPPANPKIKLVELGRVKRPASFRFMAGDGEVKIYRTEIPEKKRKI